MIAILLLDGTGHIVEANDDARALLGPCLGRRCCDIVLGREGSRELVCRPGCVPDLRASPDPAPRQRCLVVRGQPARATCAVLGEHVVVALHPTDTPEAYVQPLSPRELDVLRLIASGHETRAIATRLGVKPATVRTHVENARDKLGARTRAQAVALAVATGQLEV